MQIAPSITSNHIHHNELQPEFQRESIYGFRFGREMGCLDANYRIPSGGCKKLEYGEFSTPHQQTTWRR